jgi:hypothetical protein
MDDPNLLVPAILNLAVSSPKVKNPELEKLFTQNPLSDLSLKDITFFQSKYEKGAPLSDCIALARFSFHYIHESLSSLPPLDDQFSNDNDAITKYVLFSYVAWLVSPDIAEIPALLQSVRTRAINTHYGDLSKGVFLHLFSLLCHCCTDVSPDLSAVRYFFQDFPEFASQCASLFSVLWSRLIDSSAGKLEEGSLDLAVLMIGLIKSDALTFPSDVAREMIYQAACFLSSFQPLAFYFFAAMSRFLEPAILTQMLQLIWQSVENHVSAAKRRLSIDLPPEDDLIVDHAHTGTPFQFPRTESLREVFDMDRSPSLPFVSDPKDLISPELCPIVELLSHVFHMIPNVVPEWIRLFEKVVAPHFYDRYAVFLCVAVALDRQLGRLDAAFFS